MFLYSKIIYLFRLANNFSKKRLYKAFFLIYQRERFLEMRAGLLLFFDVNHLKICGFDRVNKEITKKKLNQKMCHFIPISFIDRFVTCLNSFQMCSISICSNFGLSDIQCYWLSLKRKIVLSSYDRFSEKKKKKIIEKDKILRSCPTFGD